jgi:hypothetical protein
MRASSFLTAAAFAVSLGASTGAIASNFSGVPDYPQAQGQDPTGPAGPAARTSGAVRQPGLCCAAVRNRFVNERNRRM